LDFPDLVFVLKWCGCCFVGFVVGARVGARGDVGWIIYEQICELDVADFLEVSHDDFYVVD
jgi:hypothetical protein